MRARVKEVRPANPEGVCDWDMGMSYHESPTTLVAVMCPECDLYVVRKVCDICISKKLGNALKASDRTWRCTYCKAPGLRADQVWRVIGKYEPHG